MLAAAARLPDPLVGLVPVLADPVHDPYDRDPGVVVERRSVLVVEVERVDELAVDVELELLGRAVADPHRRRAAVALEVVEDLLGSSRPSIPYMTWNGPERCISGDRSRPPSHPMNACASSVKPRRSRP